MLGRSFSLLARMALRRFLTVFTGPPVGVLLLSVAALAALAVLGVDDDNDDADAADAEEATVADDAMEMGGDADFGGGVGGGGSDTGGDTEDTEFGTETRRLVSLLTVGIEGGADKSAAAMLT